jgi:chromate reductase
MKVLVFAGCLHKDSINKKIAKLAANKLEEQGCAVTLIDMNDYNLPVYSQDTSPEGFPSDANKITTLMNEHSMWVIASPEHNYSITACLKNLIDWVSRAPDNQKPNMAAFANKVVAIMSASPAALGGFRSLQHLRDILTSLGTVVVPNQLCVAQSFSAFDEKGNLIDKNNNIFLDNMLKQLVLVGKKLNTAN